MRIVERTENKEEKQARHSENWKWAAKMVAVMVSSIAATLVVHSYVQRLDNETNEITEEQ